MDLGFRRSAEATLVKLRNDRVHGKSYVAPAGFEDISALIKSLLKGCH